MEPGTCLINADNDGQACLPLHVSNDVVIGSVCMKVTQSPVTMEFNYTVAHFWSLMEVKLSIGDKLQEISSGDHQSPHFPYYWCDSDGKHTWTVKVDLNSIHLCEAMELFTVFGSSKVLVGRVFNNQTLIPLTEEVATAGRQVLNSESDPNSLRYFEIPVGCDCLTELTTPKTLAPVASKPTVTCMPAPGFSGQSCYDMEIGNQVVVGQVCLTTNSNQTFQELSYHPNGSWILLDAQFWEGSDPMKSPSLENNQPFPYTWHNAAGKLSWSFPIDFKLDAPCSLDRHLLTRYALAYATFGRTFLNGTLIRDSAEVAQMQDHQDGSTIQATSNSSNSPQNFFKFIIINDCSAVSSKEIEVTENPKNCRGVPDFAPETCHSLLTSAGVEVGHICFEMDDQLKLLEVSFVTLGIWHLSSSKVHVEVGRSNASGSFEPSEATFPYYWHNSSGTDNWEFQISLNATENCVNRDSFKVAILAQVTVERGYTNGTMIEGTNETAAAHMRFGQSNNKLSNQNQPWLEFGVACKCGLKGNRNLKSTKASTGLACLETLDSYKKMCYSLETAQGTKTGTLCVELAQGAIPFVVTYTSASSKSLVRAEFWAGLDLDSLPTSSGGPATHNFPNRWSDSSGQSSWRTEFDFDFTEACSDNDMTKLYVVAHAAVGETFANGTVMPCSTQLVQAKGLHGNNDFGWFELPVRCHCPREQVTNNAHSSSSVVTDKHETSRLLALPSAEKDQDVCFKAPVGALERCFTLLVANRVAGGSLCLEIVGAQPVMKITFHAISEVWALIKSEVWIGTNPSESPDTLEAGVSSPHPFPKLRYNSSGDQSWTTHLPLNATANCADGVGGDNDGFEVFILAHAIVGRLHKHNGRIIKADKHSAIAVDPDSQATGGDVERGFGLKVLCTGCAKGRAEYEIFPLQNILWR